MVSTATALFVAFLLVAQLVPSDAACSLSLSTVTSTVKEVSPRFVHAATGAVWYLILSPTLTGTACPDMAVRVDWLGNALIRAPTGFSNVITGFSGTCNVNVGTTSGTSPNLALLVTYRGKCSAGQLGTVKIPFQLRSGNPVGFKTELHVQYPVGTLVHTVRVTWYPTGTLTVVGDPKISGFHKQWFEFLGKIGNVYHVYSDPYVMVNSQFAAANPALGTASTVMDKIFVRVAGNHTLQFSAWSIKEDSGDLLLYRDSLPMLLPADDSRHNFTSRAWLAWDGKHLTLAFGSARHVLDFTIQAHANKHINTSFVNVEVDSALSMDPATVGGLIGWTAVKHSVLKESEDKLLIAAPPEIDYIVSSLTDAKAKTNMFRAIEFPA